MINNILCTKLEVDAFVHYRYGEPTLLAFYQAAAILVGIPKWGRKHRALVTEQSKEESQQENSGEDDENMNKFCFSPVDWSSSHNTSDLLVLME